MGLVLLLLIALSVVISLRYFDVISFEFIFICCFFVYSIPAILGLIYPFELIIGRDPYLANSDVRSIIITIIAWITTTLTLILYSSSAKAKSKTTTYLNGSSKDLRQTNLILGAIVVSIFGYLIIAFTEGPLFFLVPRHELNEGYARLLWRWVNAIGFIVAISHSHRKSIFFFGLMLFIYFLAGDRTIAVITFICLTVVSSRGRTLTKYLLKPKSIFALTCILFVALFGKPFYVAVKVGDFRHMQAAFSTDYLERFFITFEPFLTFNIIDLVVSYDFQMPASSLIPGTFGQLLVAPSLFGINTTPFNTEFTSEFASLLSYGIAENYWAQAWSVAGYAGIILFGVLFGCALRFCSERARKTVGFRQIFFAFVASLLVTYMHRNSVEALLSFTRQILISMFIVFLVSNSLSYLFRRNRS